MIPQVRVESFIIDIRKTKAAFFKKLILDSFYVLKLA